MSIDVTVERAVCWFIQSRRQAGRARSTISTYARWLSEFALWLGPGARMSDVTQHTITEWRGALETTGAAPATVNVALSPLSSFLRWYAEEFGGAALRVAIRPAQPAALESLAITEADRDALLAAAATPARWNTWRVARRHVAAIRLLSETACRVSALCNLRLADVDLDRRIVYLREKGGKRQAMPFTQKTADALRAWLEVRWTTNEDFFFTSKTHRQLTPHALRSALRALAARAGVDGPVNPHAFRHGWALGAARRRLNFRLIQRGLGHVNPMTTMRYLEPTFEDLRDAVGELAPD